MKCIQLIEHEKDQKQYADLAAYCFVDDTGWTRQIFPLEPEDRAVGLFYGDNLASAAISKGFTSQIFGKIVPSTGISAVVSGPQYRNRRHIKKLLSQMIQEDYKKGGLFSALYPFNFKFYQKFGYGSLGTVTGYTIQPKDIRFTKPPSGQFVLFQGTGNQLDDMYYIYNKWVQTFDFGIILKTPSLKKFKQQCERDKDDVLLYYNNEGNCEGFLRFHLKTLEPFAIRLEIRKIAWAHPEAFKALMHLLWVHRDQCQEINWTAPLNIPVSWITVEPRITQKNDFWWMARPLDVKQLLEMKASTNPVNGKITFSIKDEIITENTATYTIEGNIVKKEPYREENTITFYVFSSILFGGISLAEAILAGLVNNKFPSEAESFFSINRNIWLSEFF